MKKNVLFLLALTMSTFSYAQNCIVVTSAAFTNPSNDNTTWNLNLNYTANGNKNLEILVYCGTTVVLNTCLDVNGSGSKTYTNIICNNGFANLSAKFTPHTGGCGSAACGPTQILPPDGGPLPILVSSFYAKRSNSTVTLSWQTESEINAKEFVLQKKTDNGFIDIASIPAKNAATGAQYSYTDNNNSKGTSQYRLKLVDNDASFKYSEIRTVKGLSAASDFVIFPNPSKGDAKVTIADISEPTTVQLIDNNGRILKNVSMNNSNTISFNGLQTGLYMVRIINNNSGESLTKKLNVVN